MSIRDEIEAWHLRNTKPIQYGAVSSSPSQDMGAGRGIPSAGPTGGSIGGMGPTTSWGGPMGGPHAGAWGWGPPMPGVHTPFGTVTGKVTSPTAVDQLAGSGRQCAPGDWKCLAEANSPGRNRIA